MGKRSNFERNPRDYYRTPYEAVIPLLPHLPDGTKFNEPCAGDGTLIGHLTKHGHVCTCASDVVPMSPWVAPFNAFGLKGCDADMFITNPPWDRSILHPLIIILCKLAPTWLLFDADWVHTKQSAPFFPYLQKIVSVGRIRWIEGTDNTGVDNCAWHLFDAPTDRNPEFIGRRPC